MAGLKPLGVCNRAGIFLISPPLFKQKYSKVALTWENYIKHVILVIKWIIVDMKARKNAASISARRIIYHHSSLGTGGREKKNQTGISSLHKPFHQSIQLLGAIQVNMSPSRSTIRSQQLHDGPNQRLVEAQAEQLADLDACRLGR